jgi:hypothetical protein
VNGLLLLMQGFMDTASLVRGQIVQTLGATGVSPQFFVFYVDIYRLFIFFTS